jgi:site-specific DNA-methyltransferase (adenine-specific)
VTLGLGKDLHRPNVPDNGGKTVIRIGNATLYLGDCYDLLPKIGKVDACVTDPPYDFKTSGGGRLRKNRQNMNRIAAAGIDKGFDHTIFRADLYRSIVTFCHNDQLHKILPHLAAQYERHVVCAWQKSNPMPVCNKHYVPELEPYIHAWQKVAHPVGDVSTLRRIVQTAVGKSVYNHPTVKPDAVMDKIISNVNADTIIDPFMGTGSTGIASLRQGKKFIGIESNAEFFNIAVSRFYALYSGV